MLLSDDMNIITYNTNTLVANVNYCMGLYYQKMERFTEAYLTFKKGYKALLKLSENSSSSSWNNKFLTKINYLKEILRVNLFINFNIDNLLISLEIHI